MQIVHDEAAQIALRALQTHALRLVLRDLDVVLGKAFACRIEVVLDRRQADIHLVGECHLRDRRILQTAFEEAADDVVLLLPCTRQSDSAALPIHESEEVICILLALELIAAIGRCQNPTLLIRDHILQSFDVGANRSGGDIQPACKLHPGHAVRILEQHLQNLFIPFLLLHLHPSLPQDLYMS